MTDKNMQSRILLGSLLAYTAAYIGRLNLSQALPRIGQFSGVQQGFLQTAFALSYAVGQLVNGAIVDRISARRHIFLGLIGTALCNLFFGCVNAYPLMAAMWLLNGAAQSMLWTPIVKLIAGWYAGVARERASFAISLSLVAGHLFAWAISGAMAANFGWRWSFWGPGLLLLILAPVCWKILQDPPETAQGPETKAASETDCMPIAPLFFKTGLWALLLCAIANGFVRDGVMTWGPTFIFESAETSDSTALLLTLCIPVLNLAGILWGKVCYQKFRGRARLATGFLTVLCALLAGVPLLMGKMNLVLLTAILGGCCAITYGVNPLLTTLIPMEYASVRRVALAAGLMDCFIYIGSSLTGVLSGYLHEQSGITSVFFCWLAVSMAGAFLCLLAHRQKGEL